MAEYPDFRHGTRGEIIANGLSLSKRDKTRQAIVYIGTAPVQQIEGGGQNVNKPILCYDIADARKYLGYSEDWAKYTLCEAMHAHFEIKAVGPVVFINVLDPAVHRLTGSTSATLTPANGEVTIVNAEDAILDTLAITRDGVALVKGTDYTARYDIAKKSIIVREVTAGSLGTEELVLTYNKVDPTAVTTANVIGSSDGYGLNTGVYAVKNVYNVTGYIPAYLLAPGFSSIPAVHAALWQNSQNISKHWNAWMFVDIPLMDGQNPISLASAAMVHEKDTPNEIISPKYLITGCKGTNIKHIFIIFSNTTTVFYEIIVIFAADRNRLIL